MNRHINIIISFLFIFFYAKLSAQKTTIYVDPLSQYRSALELYDKEKYSAAQESFSQVLETFEDRKSEVAVNAMYYHAICGLELFNLDAENLLVEFIYAYPESNKVKLAYFHLGRYKFRKKRYKQALKWFTKIDVYDLSQDELAEYKFKLGYSYFVEEDYDNASKALYEIKDTDNKYTMPARYYYAHIAYLQGKYESALQTFLSLKNDEKFSAIAPYYISQIYFLQKNYTQLLEYAPALLDSAVPKRAPEISRLIGEAYYNTEKYKDAIPYLRSYYKKKPYATDRFDMYQLGYAYYKSDSCDIAINWLKKSIEEDDSLSQAAHYHLAECYLKLGKKKYAQSSFRVASQINADPNIKEDALFSFAKISYELSMHPYNDAIIAFEEFINTYPKSTKLNDAYEFLVAVYFTTKNYKAALASLENIKVLDGKLKEAYQKIAHYRGIELFNNRKYLDAITHFNKSSKYPIDEKVRANNIFWKAEANYRINKYQAAIDGYSKFIYEPQAIITDGISKAYYNIGYSYFKLKNYENANLWFRKYIQNTGEEKTKIRNDALNRIGDCFYITKKYKAAIEYYDKAFLIGLDKSDYSLYQSAVVNGVIGNYEDKVGLLETLVNGKQKSHLLDDAIFHLGKTHLILNSPDRALSHFQSLIKDHPNSPYLSQAINKEGLIYYNQKNDNQALISFKRVVKDYPNSDESHEALQKIKKIYIERGDLTTYEGYLTESNIADSSLLVQDGDYYEVAENSYISGECDKATKELSKYLEKFPNGSYSINAHYYKADCEYKAGYLNEALIDFKYILEQPKNKFTESALLQTAVINAQLGRLEDAVKSYNQLEYMADIPSNTFKAQTEQMRLNFQLNHYDNAIKYCEIIINKDIDDATLISESHLLYGKALLAKDEYNDAFKQFSTASSAENEFGAEAKFNLAYILHLRGSYDECESEVFSLIKKFPSYPYWIGKSLILLSDNYIALNDLFQAEVTLKNVIDNSSFPELVSTAQEKLEIIKNQNNDEGNNEIEEDIDLDLFNDPDLEDLFNEEEEIDPAEETLDTLGIDNSNLDLNKIEGGNNE